jgi:hypothetical protein
MIMIFFLGAIVLGVVVSNLMEKVFSHDWQYHKEYVHHREYEQFLRERGKWQKEALLAAP